MALLDVSEVLDDPNFKDFFSFHKVRISTGSDGMPKRTESERIASGVITSYTNERALTPEAVVPSGSIAIHTRDFKIRGDIQANRDEVTWHGRRFVVSEYRDWSHYGHGFYVLICYPLEGEHECNCNR